jgi:hypothetical protein
MMKPHVLILQAICEWTAKRRVWNLTLSLNLSCRASAAFLQESQTLSNTPVLGLKAQAVDATDEGHSVMCVSVQTNDL